MFSNEIKFACKSTIHELCVFEAELIENTLLCYDMHCFKGEVTISQKYFFRIWKLTSILKELSKQLYAHNGKPYNLRAKEFISLKNQ